MNFPQRIMIFGRPGSGKSTFALHLHKIINFPLFHSDKYFFDPNWHMKSPEECFQIQQSFIHKSQWIIDGNCISCPKSFKQRFALADLIIYFNLSRWLCLLRILKRRLFKDETIYDRAKGCHETISWGLLKFTWNCELQFASLIKQLKKQHPLKNFIEIKKVKDLPTLMQTLHNHKTQLSTQLSH